MGSGDLREQTRQNADRRQKPTSPWNAWFGSGQRMRNRRDSEHLQQYFVDRFPLRTLAWILLLLSLSLTDAYFTLILLENGCEEVNPVMHHLIQRGTLSFVVGKYALTASGLPILLLFQNYFLFGTRFRVGYVIPSLVIMYTVLITYQWYLLHA